jgi:cytochrome c oxidase subunit III
MPDSTLPEFIEATAANGASYPSAVPQRTYITGVIISLSGIAMFFIALVSAFVVREGFPDNDWQPLAVPRILWLNTAILLASSFTLARARKHFLAHREETFRHWWSLTVILGLLFIVGQGIAWRQLWSVGIFLATNPSSSFFYVFTFAHALHLLGGIAALFMIAIRPTRYLTRRTATEIAMIYWHFMDALWLGLFILFLMSQ